MNIGNGFTVANPFLARLISSCSSFIFSSVTTIVALANIIRLTFWFSINSLFCTNVLNKLSATSSSTPSSALTSSNKFNLYFFTPLICVTEILLSSKNVGSFLSCFSTHASLSKYPFGNLSSDKPTPLTLNPVSFSLAYKSYPLLGVFSFFHPISFEYVILLSGDGATSLYS